MPDFIRRASLQDWVFSLRTLGAGLLALYLALALGLDEPKWSLMTVYIVAQPLGGMVLGKGLYRLLGTFAGALMALLMVALFAQTPLLFFAAMGIWLAICTFCATLLRNFRAYAFVLSGYTAMIIGLPGALAPDHAFAMALARVTEIGLGIGCSALTSLLIWPQSAGDAFLVRCREQLFRLLGCVVELARGELNSLQLQQRRQELINSGVMLETLREHALFDSVRLRQRAALCRRLGHETLAPLSLLGPLSAYLERYASVHPDADVQAMLARLGALSPDMPLDSLRESLGELYQDIQQLAQSLREDFVEQAPEPFYARQMALEHMAEICDRLHSATVLYAMITDQKPVQGWRAGSSRLHLDVRQAARNGLRSLLAVLAAAGLWMATAASQGIGIIIIVAVVCSLFATRDDPVKAATGFVKGALLAMPIAALYRCVLLPGSEGFLGLALWLFPFYLIAGLAMTKPATLGLSSATTIFFPNLLNLGPGPDLSVVGLFNDSLGLMVGIGLAVLSFLLIWPSDNGVVARFRLSRDLCRSVSRWPIDRRRPRQALETLLYDRIGRTMPVLNMAQPGDGQWLQGCMALVTFALGLVYLDVLCRRGLPEAVCLELRAFVGSCQRTLRDGDAIAWHQQVEQARALADTCRRAYSDVQSVGERRRLVRAVVRLHMMGNIIETYQSFFLAGSAHQQEVSHAA